MNWRSEVSVLDSLRFFLLSSSVVFLASCGGKVVGDSAGDDGGGGNTGDSGESPPQKDSGIVIQPFDAGLPETSEPETGPVEAGPEAEAQAPLGLVTVPLSGCVPYYTANVSLGGGAEPFSLLLDTGSTTLAVASSACTDCSVSPLYTPGAPAVDQHQTATSTYGGGEMWSGEIYSDSVSVGTPTASTSVRLVAIDTQSEFFSAPITCGTSATPYTNQGIIGFAPGSSAVMGTNGFFDQLVAGGSVSNVFATELCDMGGTLWLGGYDTTAVTAPPQYTSLSASAFDSFLYAVDLEQVTVAGASVPVPTGGYTESVVDTGTSIFILAPAAFTEVTAAISADAGFQSVFGASGASFLSSPDNCVNLTQTAAEIDAALPPMSLVFGTSPAITVTATATESYLVSYSPGLWCPSLYSNAPSADLPLASIIGSPMLRSSVVIFDRGGMRLGFAPHAPCP
jgi:Eukaryotic aspartyl protease